MTARGLAARARPAALALLASLALAPALTHASASAGTAAKAPPPARVERFSGHVEAGRGFERRVFGDLRFRLTPHAGAPGVGWTITLGQRDTLADFVAVVTPPYRGVNARDIHAWHFAEKGPDGEPPNAPREEREFRFVRGQREHDAALAALQLALWPNGRPMAAADSALAVVESLAVGTGTLTMRNVRRGPPDRDGVPVLAAFDFDVVLTLPGAAR